jgi:hypothetical protein
VVDDDAAIAGGVNIEFDAIGIEHHRTPEGGSRVFILVSGGAPVGDHSWPTHGPKIVRDYRTGQLTNRPSSRLPSG